MAETSEQDKTEHPTTRRLSKAREDGEVARSVELPAAAITIAVFTLLMLAGGWMVHRLTEVFASGFVFDGKALAQPSLLPTLLADALRRAFFWVSPVLLLTMVVAVVASGLTGGYLFAPKAVAPKWSKLSPVNGFKRMFGMRALVELGKALLKFALVSTALWWMIMASLQELVGMGRMALEPAMASAGALIAYGALAVALTLVLIALIDVPYQKHAFIKRLRMSKQEVKDELKDLEGRPEVKAQIRRRQREMANARMMQQVKDADVVITNPAHFSVALSYDPDGDSAPLVVAKGVDFMAASIREEAERHGIQRFEAPELARALYFTTDIDQPIPESLYHAVAQVIAYVFSLEASHPGRAGMKRPDPQVPASMRFDTEGQRLEPDPMTAD
jgi:flagellar biosynthesis protein FlhB